MAVDLGFDESGSGDTLLVSVQVGVTEQAKKLKKHWLRRLGNLEYFHSKDFNNYTSGVFTKAGLTRPDRQALLKDLARLIRTRLSVGIVSLVSKAEYNENTTQAFRSLHGTAYGFLIDMCLVMTDQLIGDMGIVSDFNILVEDGHRNAQQVAMSLRKLNLPSGVRILTSGLGSKKDHPILQASDMLCYSQWQGHRVNGDGTIWRALHRPETIQYRPWIINCDRDVIREFVKGNETRQAVRKFFKGTKYEQAI
jgi:hypothetical protein